MKHNYETVTLRDGTLVSEAITLPGDNHYSHLPQVCLHQLNFKLRGDGATPLSRFIDRLTTVADTRLDADNVGGWQAVARFVVRPRKQANTFFEFRSNPTTMTPAEYEKRFGAEPTNEGMRVWCYGDSGLHIVETSPDWFHLVLENEDWYTQNIIELQLRLYNWHLHNIQAKHPFTTVDETPGHIGYKTFLFYINLVRYVDEATKLNATWIDNDIERNLGFYISVDNGYPEGLPSFDEHVEGLLEWRNEMLSRI